MHLVEAVHVFVCYQNLSIRSTARIFSATKNLSINNFPISLPESDEGSSKMRESQVS